MRAGRFTLLLLVVTPFWTPGCGGRAERPTGDESAGGAETHSGGNYGASVGGHQPPPHGDGDGDGDGDVGGTSMGEPPSRTGGMGGQLVINPSLWCPVDDEWELLLGAGWGSLGGAPGADLCPDLPRLDVGVSGCVTLFESQSPVVRQDTQSCCYVVASIYCR